MRKSKKGMIGIVVGLSQITVSVLFVSPYATGQMIVAPSIGGGATGDMDTGSLLSIGHATVDSISNADNVLEAGVMFCYVDMGSKPVEFFDDFDDNFLDPCDWYTTLAPGGNIIEDDGSVTISSTGNAHPLLFPVYVFHGDFDVYVDFRLLSFPSVTACHSSLRVYSIEEPNHSVVLKRNRGLGWNEYQFFKYDDSGQVGVSNVPTDDMSGAFRIQRVNDVFTGYYWNGGWIPLGSTNYFTEPVKIGLDSFGTLQFPYVSTEFDNFHVVADAVVSNGDSDADGDVDLHDFKEFTICLDGPGFESNSNCWFFADFDCDRDVDLYDFAIMQKAFSGP